jgi:RimJ/RimL family protein N-acetyltransferase
VTALIQPLEGRLVRLRAREPEDEPSLYRWFNDPEVTRHLTVRYPLSHAQEKSFLDSAGAPAYANVSLAVETIAEGQLIGGVGLHGASAENRAAELGIAIGEKSHWDGGYGTDTMRVICRFGFEMMNLHRIELLVYASNERAIHVYEKVGFVLEGRRRDAVFKYGRYDDVIVMGLLEGEVRLA